MINWNADKSLELISIKDISFEEIVFYLDNDGLTIRLAQILKNIQTKEYLLFWSMIMLT
ncbi:hypothetical protein CRYPA_92 [uncultured Candidatus Thioglobus sp.]|nr:hypothetical protein CRYPA_92 [uncultured Candidatus Thioglobus sp.]